MESKKRILIADADVVFRDALIEALSEEGDMEVVGTTDDGERAVELVRSCKPDILVMDLILSHMDGLDVLAALDAAGRPKVMVLSALARSELEHLSVYTEVMQDAVVELIDAGKVACASGTALTISPSARERFYAHIDDYKGKIILRPQELSNAPEVIRRLSIIAMNTAIEVDLAGNANSTHIGEGAVMNGIGGSGDYAGHRHFLHRLHRQGRRHLLHCAPRGPRGSHGARHRDHRHRAGPGGSAGPDGLRAGPCPD